MCSVWCGASESLASSALTRLYLVRISPLHNDTSSVVTIAHELACESDPRGRGRRRHAPPHLGGGGPAVAAAAASEASFVNDIAASVDERARAARALCTSPARSFGGAEHYQARGVV